MVISESLFREGTKQEVDRYLERRRRAPNRITTRLVGERSVSMQRMRMVRWTQAIPAVIVIFFIVSVLLYRENHVLTDTQSKLRALERWSECAQKQLNDYYTAEEFWLKFASLTGACDAKEHIEQLGLVPLENDDEVKYALLPTTSNTFSTFITLGIGKDISAEQLFKKESEYRNQTVQFFGADPISEENAQLYSQIGKYFPFAVGEKAGVTGASVFVNGSYTHQDVIHVELLYFLKNILQVTDIDHLWLDAESAEFGVFDYFYNDGPLEENGISFCQMNLEVHIGSVDRKFQFMKFAKRLAAEKRFAMLKSVYMSHNRLYLFNYGNPKCVEKYL